MTRYALTLALSESQITQLIGYCAEYRAYAWRSLPPTPERNQMLRTIQAIQGRLSQGRAEGVVPVWLLSTDEEKQALRQMMSALMQLRGAESASEQRNRVLGELAHLRMLIERPLRQTQALANVGGIVSGHHSA